MFERGARPTTWPVQLSAQGCGLLWSPDGRRLGLSAPARPLRLFDQRGEQLASIDEAAVDLRRRGVRALGQRLAWSSDAQALAFAAGDHLVVLTPDGDETHRLSHAPEHVDSVAWSGGLSAPLATATKETVRVWTPAAEALPRLPGATFALSSPRGERVALCRPDELLIHGGEREVRVRVPGVPRASWSPSGKHLLAHSGGSAVALRARDGQEVASLRLGGSWAPSEPDRALFSRPPSSSDGGGSLWLIDIGTGREAKLVAPSGATIMAGQGARWSDAGEPFGLATTQPEHRLRLWRGSAPDPTQTELVPGSFPPEVALEPGRKSFDFDVTRQGDLCAVLMVSPERGVLHLRQLGARAAPRQLELPLPRARGRGTRALEFSPQGRFLFARVDLDGFLIDPRAGTCQALAGEVTGFAWAPSGEILALEGARGVQLIHAETRVELDRFPGKCGVAWSRDGRRLYLARPRSTEVVGVPALDQPAGPLLERARALGF